MQVNEPLAEVNIYKSLGITPIINAAGTFTNLGGSLMPPEVVTAWQQAAEHFVDMAELQTCIGNRIADLLHVPAAMVTGGAAHAILLGVAAAITARNPEFPTQSTRRQNQPDFEVLRQRSHRDLYDRQVETCGVRLIDVESAEDVARVVSERTVLMMAYNVYVPESAISHMEWISLAKQYQLPTLLDAAADTPPVANLSQYTNLGYDLVAFSGGKAIRGPQDSGLLLGTPPLVELARQNASPIEGTIGRVSKVSKEDMVALWRAVELFVQCGDSIPERCQNQLHHMAEILSAEKAITCEFVTPQPANCFPHLQLHWDESEWSLTAEQLAHALRHGTPPIATGRVYGTGTTGLLLSAINLQPGEDRIVAERILTEFRSRRGE